MTRFLAHYRIVRPRYGRLGAVRLATALWLLEGVR